MEKSNFISQLEIILIKNNVKNNFNIGVTPKILADFLYKSLENLIHFQKSIFISTEIDKNYDEKLKNTYDKNDIELQLYIDIYNLIVDCKIHVLDANSALLASYLINCLKNIEFITTLKICCKFNQN